MTKSPPFRLWFRWSALLLLWLGGLAGRSEAAGEGRTALFLGDSLTAGYGLEEPGRESYVGLVGARLAAAQPGWKVVNAGVSGETSSGGLRRIDWVLRQPVDVLFLALGANDGLRGIPAGLTESNLAGIIAKVRAKNPAVAVVVAGMKMPSNMGPYAADFAAVYGKLRAADRSLVLLPFLLEGVAGEAGFNQADAIHPNAAGHRKMADLVWGLLEPLLRARAAA